MRTSIFYLSFLLLSLNIYSQSKDEVIRKVIENYTSSKPLKYTTTYNLYKNEKSKVIQESYKGVYQKISNNSIYVKIHTTEFFYGDNLYTKISHSEKIIQVLNPGGALEGEYDVKKLFLDYKIESLKDKKGYWELNLTSKPFSGVTFSKITLEISKDYYIKKQILYSGSAVNFSKDFKSPDIHHPVLEIICSDHSRKPEQKTQSTIQQYFTIKNGKIVLATKYSNYKILDQRN